MKRGGMKNLKAASTKDPSLTLRMTVFVSLRMTVFVICNIVSLFQRLPCTVCLEREKTAAVRLRVSLHVYKKVAKTF
ncbi:hypothetical protein [Tepidanaerobacter sp. EBM-38]|uniref:hypothetical protein n=1 Tax=Tepidanaerobacter sp. EBM-38 TaxID=1918496 RepID=UPI0025DBACEA|nr:hypothetical protein [Tepidanaerobacter sp. EBM-38]